MIVWNSNFFAYICDCITIVFFMKNTDNQIIKYLFSVIVFTFFAFGVYAQQLKVDMPKEVANQHQKQPSF